MKKIFVRNQKDKMFLDMLLTSPRLINLSAISTIPLQTPIKTVILN